MSFASKPYYRDEFATLHHGKSEVVLVDYADESFDALVTDPPAGIGFLEREWDSDKGGRSKWVAWLASILREAYRVLKPGAHGLVWAIPRTSHWTACALEDAGFEVRDRVTHIFGGLFPKSLDVASAIDKSKDVRADVLAVTRFIRRARDASGKTNAQIDALFVTNGMAGHWTSVRSQPAVPTNDQWAALKEFLGASDKMDAEIRRINEDKGVAGEAFRTREVVGTRKTVDLRHSRPVNTIRTSSDGKTRRREIDVTVAKTDDAKKWEGFGTALKGGVEDWWLVRKPLRGKVQSSVRKYGTGALDIASSRVGTRWPSNLIFSHADDCSEGACTESCPVAELVRAAGADKVEFFKVFEPPFFYAGKIKKGERGDNHHPTIKTLALMRYLLTLVVPPGGIVLDAFAGSGTTLVAAKELGIRSVGVEQEEDHCRIIRDRVESASFGGNKRLSPKLARAMRKGK